MWTVLHLSSRCRAAHSSSGALLGASADCERPLRFSTGSAQCRKVFFTSIWASKHREIYIYVEKSLSVPYSI